MCATLAARLAESSPASFVFGSFQRSSTGSGGRKQTALFTVVEPPTQLPWSTVKLKSSVCCITPSAYSRPIISTSLSVEVARLDVAAALQHEHVVAGLRQLVREDRPAGAAADDADLRLERASPSGCSTFRSSGLRSFASSGLRTL